MNFLRSTNTLTNHPTTRPPFFFFHTLLGLILFTALTGVLLAEQKKNPPTVEQIIEDFLLASGEKANHDKIRNRVSKGSMEVIGTGIKIAITSYEALPNAFYLVIESDALGKIEKGSNGDIVWENSVMNGPQIKEGEERSINLLTNRMDMLYNWKTLFKKVELSGEEVVEGTPCYKVTLIPKAGQPIIYFFDQKSKLLIKDILTYTSPQGIISEATILKDYKPFDGILIATKNITSAAGREFLVLYDSIQHNVNIPKDLFQLPAEIKALLKK